MDKALHVYLFLCVFTLVLTYLGMMKLTQLQHASISGLYNSIPHARDVDLDDVTNTSSLDKDVHQKMKDLQLIKDGIFWSDVAESFVPAGSSIENSNKIVSYLRSQDVKSLTTANYSDCGLRDNGIAVLGDGTRICVRHRNRESNIQGDALAFHLSRMLKMDNVPVMFLTKISSSASLWRQLNISTLPWKKNETVGMIKWIPDASTIYGSFVHLRKGCLLSPIIKEAYRIRTPITKAFIRKSELDGDPASIAHLIQLGTSIIFDYLICLRDRLYRRQNLVKERFGDLWIHNTVQSLNGKVWLIDNESAFACWSGNNVTEFHNNMLKTICVFQSSIVTALKVLSEQASAFKRLLSYSTSFEPLLNTIHLHTRYRSEMFAIQFDDRLAKIMEWIQSCREKYT